MNYKLSVGAFMLLSACSGFTLEPASSELVESDFGLSSNYPVIDRGSDLVVDGLSFESRSFGPASFDYQPVCTVAKQVFGVGLGITTVCNAEGLFAAYFAVTDAQVAFDSLVGSLRSAGYQVSISSAGIEIIGGDRENRSRAVGPASTDLDPETLDLLMSLSEPFTESVGSVVVSSGDLVVRSLDRVQGPDVALMVNRLGLDVEIYNLGGYVLAVGPVESVDVLTAVSSDALDASYVLDVSAEVFAALDGFSASFDVQFFPDPASSRLMVTGSPLELSRFFEFFRSGYSSPSLLRVSSVFVSNASRLSDVLDLDIGGRVVVGGGVYQAVVGIGSRDRPLGVVLDAVSSASDVSVVSRPSIVVRSGSSGVFRSGDEIPVFGSFDDKGVRAVEYRPVGVTVTASPVLTSGDAVLLRLAIEIVTVSDAQGVDGNPIFSSRSVTTELRVKVGQVVAISGFSGVSNSVRNETSFWVLPANRQTGTSEELTFFVTVEKIS